MNCVHAKACANIVLYHLWRKTTSTSTSSLSSCRKSQRKTETDSNVMFPQTTICLLVREIETSLTSDFLIRGQIKNWIEKAFNPTAKNHFNLSNYSKTTFWKIFLLYLFPLSPLYLPAHLLLLLRSSRISGRTEAKSACRAGAVSDC